MRDKEKLKMILTYSKKAVIFLLVTILSWHYLSFSFLHSSKIQNASATVLFSEKDQVQENLTISTHFNPLAYDDFNEMLALAEEYSRQYNWNKIDRSLATNLKTARLNAEELAQFELNSWKKRLMKKVDNEFLEWYFSFSHQKAMEFGVPFAWLAFKIDQPFNNLSKEKEKDLNASEIIQKRMVEDFNRKFQELVFDQDSEDLLKESIERIGITYATSIATQFSKVKAQYQVLDIEWEKHLGRLADLIYNTGNSQSDLSSEALNSNLSTKVFAATAVTIGTKLAAKFGTKATGKIAGKAGASIAAKAGAQLLDPILAVGFLVWDVWDYKNMVDKSRPELRQNISDYLEELKYSILSGEDGIFTGISEVEANLYYELKKKNVSSNYS